MDSIITLAVLVFSAIVHEVMHGVVAEYFGDDTARRAGRITLNPLPHIDPIWSVALPLLLLLSGSPIVFGAAKPVPVDFANFRKRRLGMAAVSLAGPFSNFALAVIGALILKFGLAVGFAYPVILKFTIINIVLGVFNLLPIPPLDGSKVLASLGGRAWSDSILAMDRLGILLVLVFLMFGWLDKILFPVIQVFFQVFQLG